jgi:hypothetical protein
MKEVLEAREVKHLQKKAVTITVSKEVNEKMGSYPYFSCKKLKINLCLIYFFLQLVSAEQLISSLLAERRISSMLMKTLTCTMTGIINKVLTRLRS